MQEHSSEPVDEQSQRPVQDPTTPSQEAAVTPKVSLRRRDGLRLVLVLLVDERGTFSPAPLVIWRMPKCLRFFFGGLQ